jgi:hypothetical protein
MAVFIALYNTVYVPTRFYRNTVPYLIFSSSAFGLTPLHNDFPYQEDGGASHDLFSIEYKSAVAHVAAEMLSTLTVNLTKLTLKFI